MDGFLGKYGTHKATNARTLSGLSRLRCQPATAPQSAPTTNAFFIFFGHETSILIHRRKEKIYYVRHEGLFCHLVLAKVVDEADEVSDDVKSGVRARAERRVRVTIASQVWCHHMVAVVSQEVDLMTP